MTEEWKPVPGFEGLYEAGYGAVRSLDRVDAAGRRIKGRTLKPGRLVDEQGNPTGYFLLVLCKDGRKHRLKLHRVIASAFHGEPEDGAVVRHLDGDPLNNHPDNLRWGTPSENSRDRLAHGTDHHVNRTHCPQEHEYAGRNLITTPSGGRRCRACVYGRTTARRKGGDWKSYADDFYSSWKVGV